MYKKRIGKTQDRSRTQVNRDSPRNEVVEESESKEEVLIRLKSDQRKYAIRIALLIVINSVLFGFLIKGSSSVLQSIFSAFSANLVGFNLLGLMLGVLVALLPYKGLNFKEKYLRSSILTILSIQITLAGSLVLIGMLRLIGWY